MPEKVVIAAAGQGTRMLHLTKNKPKHLIKVNQKPFLAYILDNLLSAGYRELILVVGYKEKLMEDFIKEYKPAMKSLKKNDYKIILLSQYDILGPKEKIYGTACPLMCVKDILKDEQFLFICGDNLYSVDDLKEMKKDDDYNYVAGLIHENPENTACLSLTTDF